MKIRMIEAPGQFNDSARQFEATIRENLSHGADVVGVTESGGSHFGGPRHPIMADVARDEGYRLVQTKYPLKYGHKGDHTGTALLLRKDHGLLKSGFIDVLPGQPGPARQGGHEPRGLTFMLTRIEDELVYFGQGHLLTHGRPGDPDSEPHRIQENRHYIEVSATVMNKQARGFRLGFLLFDSNQPKLHIPGMTSIWDEMQKFPNKPDPIVTILSHDLDRRVHAISVKELSRTFSDHPPAEAVYGVDSR